MRKIAATCVKHHNKIQFLGYELANIVLVGQAFFLKNSIDNNTAFETCAAIALLIGSICIWKYDPVHQATMLYYGGIGLTLGGVFLTMAGYPITGLSVTLASLETTRGGIFAIIDHCKTSIAQHTKVSVFTRKTLKIAVKLFGWYIKIIKGISRRFKSLGTFIDTRPFLSGALIKAPLRLEFVLKNIATGDLVAAGVGVSWMILGDGGLALNDEKLKSRLAAYSTS